MTISRAQRRAERRDRVVGATGEDNADAALDLLELVEYAWHDCYGEVTPPDDVIADILVVGGDRFDRLVSAALLAVRDFRDLRVSADDARRRRD